MKIKIAFLQVLPGKDIKENLAIGKKACVEAKEMVLCQVLAQIKMGDFSC